MNVFLLYHKCASQWTKNVFRQLAGIKNEFLYMGNREPEKGNGVLQNDKIEATLKCRLGLGRELNYEFFEEFIDEISKNDLLNTQNTND